MPHAARHGGASTDAFLKVRSLHQIQLRGRWGQKTVERYRKSGVLLKQVNRLTDAQVAEAARTAPLLAKLLKVSL